MAAMPRTVAEIPCNARHRSTSSQYVRTNAFTVPLSMILMDKRLLLPN